MSRRRAPADADTALTFSMVLSLMTQVMLAGGLLLDVTHSMRIVSPPRACCVPSMVTRSGPTAGGGHTTTQ